MAIKGIFKLLAVTILIITILNCSYADTGPNIGPNQAKTIAQNYLNSHNLPYTTVTPGWDAWKFYVKDTQTGEKKWLAADIVMADDPAFDGPGRYKGISSVFNDIGGVWFVQVNDKNGKNVGQIYVDADDGKVLKTTIPTKSQTKNPSTIKDLSTAKTTNNTNTNNLTSQIPESNSQSGPSGNSTGIIFGIIALIIATGAGYFMYTRI